MLYVLINIYINTKNLLKMVLIFLFIYLYVNRITLFAL